MRITLYLFLVVCVVSTVRGADINADSASYAHVNTAVGTAVNGDRVLVPAGSASWGSQLNLGTKTIQLIGAGTNSTIISNTFGDALIISAPNTTNSVVRISGFRFDQSYGKFYLLSFKGPALIRVDHCEFRGGEEIVDANWNQSGTGRVLGVVDHNLGHNVRIFNRGSDVRTADSQFGDTAWTETFFQYGTTNQITFEDNLFTFDSNFTQAGDAAVFYNHYGAKGVYRFNRFATNSDSGFQQNYIDAHGDEGNKSTMRLEVYGNTFIEGTQGSAGADQMENMRGGRLVNFSNVWTSTKVPIGLIRYDSSNIRSHDVTNTYCWANTWNGSTVQADIVEVQDTSPCNCSVANIVVNDHYFLRPPGGGDTGETSLTNYVPLIYPHPLVTAQDGGGTPPTFVQAPTGLRWRSGR